MKTSNKILVGAFALALLILVSVHVTLYAKYKKGDFTVVPNEWQPNLATFSLDNVKYLSVDNIDNISVHLADSSKIAYEKPGADDENVLSFTKKNDTLFVTGKNGEGNIRWYRRTDLYLSQDLPLKFTNSSVHLSEKKAGLPTRALNFNLDKTLLDIDNLGSATSYFSSVNISASNKSRISIGDVYLNNLHITLANSSVEEEKQLAADSIFIATDSLSKIALRAHNLTKAKLTDHE